MSSFAEQIAAVDIPATALPDAQPPRIWWHNGVKVAKTPGNFYTKADEFPGGLAAPWEHDDRFESEAGFSTRTLKIAPLAVRNQPFRKIKDTDGRDRVEYARRWEAGMSIHTEILCLMEGYDGAVVWSMKGLTGKAVTGKGGILTVYRNGLLREAGLIAKKGLPLWAFWLPISSKMNGDKIAYEDSGFGSLVTPPALVLPDAPLDTLFVGPDVLQRGADVLHDMAAWADYKRLPDNVVEGEVVYAALPAPAATGRNVPVAMSANDEF